MNIAIVGLIIVADFVDDLIGFLRCCTIVKPYEVVSVHLLLEHREVFFNLLRVQRIHFLVVQLTQFCLAKGTHTQFASLRGQSTAGQWYLEQSL